MIIEGSLVRKCLLLLEQQVKPEPLLVLEVHAYDEGMEHNDLGFQTHGHMVLHHQYIR